MKKLCLTLAMILAAPFAIAYSPQSPTGESPAPICTIAQLNASSCPGAVEVAGRLAVITDGNEAAADMCNTATSGDVQTVCMYINNAWRQITAQNLGGGSVGDYQYTTAADSPLTLTPDDCNAGLTIWSNASGEAAEYILHDISDRPGSICKFHQTASGSVKVTPQALDNLIDAGANFTAGRSVTSNEAGSEIAFIGDSNNNYWFNVGFPVGVWNPQILADLDITSVGPNSISLKNCDEKVITNTSATAGTQAGIELPEASLNQYSYTKTCVFVNDDSDGDGMRIYPKAIDRLDIFGAAQGQAIETTVDGATITFAAGYKNKNVWVPQLGGSNGLDLSDWSLVAGTGTKYDPGLVPDTAFITSLSQIDVDEAGGAGQVLIWTAGNIPAWGSGSGGPSTVMGQTDASVDITDEAVSFDGTENDLVFWAQQTGDETIGKIAKADMPGGGITTVACDPAQTGTCLFDQLTASDTNAQFDKLAAGTNVTFSAGANGEVNINSTAGGGTVTVSGADTEWCIPVFNTGGGDQLIDSGWCFDSGTTLLDIPTDNGFTFNAPTADTGDYGTKILWGSELVGNGGFKVWLRTPEDLTPAADINIDLNAAGQIPGTALDPTTACTSAGGAGCPAGITLPIFSDEIAVATISTTLGVSDDFSEVKVWRGADITIANVSCHSDVDTAQVQIVFNGATDLHSGAIVCDDSNHVAGGDVNVVDGDTFTLDITSGSGINRLTVAWDYTFD